MINKTLKLVRNIIRDEKGLTAVEYAVLGGIVVAAITAVGITFTADLTAAFGAMFP